MVIKRLLLNKEVEVLQISESFYGDTKYYMVFYDYKRPSTFEDFSFIPGMTIEDFSSRDNYIQAIIIYDKEMTDEEKELIYEIASGFLEDKDNCDWTLKYIQADFNELMPISTNHKILINKLNILLKTVNPSIKEIIVDEDSFKYLIQD